MDFWFKTICIIWSSREVIDFLWSLMLMMVRTELWFVLFHCNHGPGNLWVLWRSNRTTTTFHSTLISLSYSTWLWLENMVTVASLKQRFLLLRLLHCCHRRHRHSNFPPGVIFLSPNSMQKTACFGLFCWWFCWEWSPSLLCGRLTKKKQRRKHTEKTKGDRSTRASTIHVLDQK